MFNRKKDNSTKTLPTHRSKTSFNFKLPEFDLKKITISSLIIILTAVIVVGVGIFINQYKTDNYKINNLKNIPVEEIVATLSKNNNKPLVQIDTNVIEEEISKSSIFVKEVKVSKSLIDGMVIEIIEREPLILIQTPELKLYYIDTNYEILEVEDENEVSNMQRLTFLSNDIRTSNIINYLKKVMKVKTTLTEIDFTRATFDNFGNLSILLEGERVIRFDLNERFFAIDEQISLLQDTLSKNPNLKEIDLRFSYLLTK